MNYSNNDESNMMSSGTNKLEDKQREPWNGASVASNSHHVLSQPMTTETGLNESVLIQRQTSLCTDEPPSPVPLNEAPDGVFKEKDGEESESKFRRRAHRRLMLCICVTTVLYVTAMLSQGPVLTQYIFRRFALELFNGTNFTTRTQTSCLGPSNSSDHDDMAPVQAKAANQMLNLDYSQYIPAIFVSLLVGSYADYFGRRFLVLVPMFGSLLKCVNIVLVVYLDLEVDYLYIGFVLEGLLGSFYAMQVGCLSAMADVTTTARQRVLLMVFLNISVGVAGTVAQIGTGYLIRALGFEVPSLMVACLALLSFVGNLFFMPETLRTKPQHRVLNPFVHLRKVFGFYVWDGTLWQRALFVCGQVILFLVTLVSLGRMGVEILYVMNAPFCWDSVRIGFFFGIRFLVQNVAGAVFVKVMLKWIRLEFIGMLGLLSGIVSVFMQGVAKTDLVMYITVPVGCVISVVSPITRTLLSKMVSAENQGALFASMSAVETVCHLSASIFYNNVYSATLHDFPGAVFLLTALLLLFDIVLLICFTVAMGKFPQFQKLQDDGKTDDADADVIVKSVASSSMSSDDDNVTHL